MKRKSIIARSKYGNNVIWKKEAENVKRKQIVSLLLTLVMVLTLMPVSVGAVEDTATNGTCGDNLIWQLDGNIQQTSGATS